MDIYDMMFILNSMVLAGIIVYHCLKGQKKAMISNIIILLVFILIKMAQVNYIALRSGLYDLLGEEQFDALRNILRGVLFFASSVTVGIELLSELISLLMLVFVAAKVTAWFVRKCAKDIFASSVSSEDEKAEDRIKYQGAGLYLVLGKLLN